MTGRVDFRVASINSCTLLSLPFPPQRDGIRQDSWSDLSAQNNFLFIELGHSSWQPLPYIILSSLMDMQVNSKCIFLAFVTPPKLQIYHPLLSNIFSWNRHLRLKMPTIELLILTFSQSSLLEKWHHWSPVGHVNNPKVFLISLFPLLPLSKPS